MGCRGSSLLQTGLLQTGLLQTGLLQTGLLQTGLLQTGGGTDEDVFGWAALSPYSRRPVYAGVAEVSVYVAEAARGRGVGAALLAGLVTESMRNGFRTLQAGIFPENIASIRLHERCGFRVPGTRERILPIGRRLSICPTNGSIFRAARGA